MNLHDSQDRVYLFAQKTSKNDARGIEPGAYMVMGLSRGIPEKGLIPSSLIAEKVTKATEVLETLDESQKKVYTAMLNNLLT